MKYLSIFLIITISFLWSCKQDGPWKGQEAVKKVDTHTKPIQKQVKGVFHLGDSVFCSNNFDGARLNGAVLTDDTLITVLITAENTPINKSPWYAFKIWSVKEKNMYLKITYLDGYRHRYYPKLSNDGINWHILDSSNYFEDIESKKGHERGFPTNITMKLTIEQDTTWIAGQEIITSKDVNIWAQSLAAKPFVQMDTIGESHEGRPIVALSIGEADDSKMISVLSRQHPPEVSGYIAMVSFIETICGESETADMFRKEYNTYVVPCINPDGIDNGHWRHNSGGIDLNRDWEDFNQPEVKSVKSFLKEKTEAGGKFYFAVDFHSTWEDIYYINNPEIKGNMPGIVSSMIEESAKNLDAYQPNIKPIPSGGNKITSDVYLFNTLGAESLTYEVGDETPRDFVRKKAEITALTLMELMLKYDSGKVR